MPNITNVNVWGVKESIIASGYPMTNGDTPSMDTINSTPEGFKRLKNLGSVKGSTGHDCALKGIVVQFDWKISQTIYPQVERYHFIDIISSQSKMHRLKEAKIGDFNEYVDPVILERFMELVENYNLSVETGTTEEQKYSFNQMVYSLPMGYEMTARFTTNYLQLKTIYHQRKNHKLQEWRDFCDWIELLPNFQEFVLS